MAAASAEEIQTVLRDALNTYDSAVGEQEVSPIWAGPEHDYARAWLRERRTIAMALVTAIDAIPAINLKLILLPGGGIEL